MIIQCLKAELDAELVSSDLGVDELTEPRDLKTGAAWGLWSLIPCHLLWYAQVRAKRVDPDNALQLGGPGPTSALEQLAVTSSAEASTTSARSPTASRATPENPGPSY